MSTTSSAPPLVSDESSARTGVSADLAQFEVHGLTVSVVSEGETVWAVVHRPGKGRVALRLVHSPGGASSVRSVAARDGERLRFIVSASIGSFEVALHSFDDGMAMLRSTVSFTPSQAVNLPRLPRDLFVLDDGDGSTAEGRVEAAQRGFNGGLVYFHVDRPRFGTVLYLQNLSALNEYYLRTGTTPDGVVGGEWPELGYLMPVPEQAVAGTTLEPGRAVTVSDAIVVFDGEVAKTEQDSAIRFLKMVSTAFALLDRPTADFHDWPARARMTLHDLKDSPDATVKHYGCTYLRPYNAAEYPDVMVQGTVLSALQRWAEWTGAAVPFTDELEAGLDRFYDADLGTLRRYLPNVGSDKNPHAVDSWYLYHPLVSLGQLAIAGNEHARRLFLDSLNFAIKSAHHFDYCWPIQYDIRNFNVITASRDGDGNGQTDVGGIYAWVMLHAHEITGEDGYIDEARTAIDRSSGMRFNIEYQANLTAMGAAACARLWRLTGDREYLRQSYVYIASFVHNCELWESQLGFAGDYPNFFGATCLHDAQYIASYECSDSFATFQHYLREGDDELDPSARFLVTQFCCFALDRAWYYYPDALPAGSLAAQCRNGFIATGRSRSRTCTRTGSHPGRWGRRCTAAARRSSSPPRPSTASRESRSRCTATTPSPTFRPTG